MKSATPIERQRLRTSSGRLPASKIAFLAASHPFTQQIDVVFPSNRNLLEALQNLETSYRKGKARLYDVFNDNMTALGEERSLLIVSHFRHGADIWSIDPRGHLTICVSKDSYERLGLVGKKLPFNNQQEYHVIDVPLRKNAHSPKNLDKVKSAFLRWDERSRAESGDESWDMVYCSPDPGNFPQISSQVREEQICKVQCRKREMLNVNVPHVLLEGPTNRDSDAIEDQSQHLHSIFEWIGMACFGAQRLYANDRVATFVAVYQPPAQSYVGNVMHLRWTGLLSPIFVQRVLDVILDNVSSSMSSPPFVGITSHALTRSPVSYIPSNPGQIPLKLPQENGEDTWSLLLGHSAESGAAKDTEWCLTESLGRYDNRWG